MAGVSIVFEFATRDRNRIAFRDPDATESFDGIFVFVKPGRVTIDRSIVLIENNVTQGTAKLRSCSVLAASELIGLLEFDAFLCVGIRGAQKQDRQTQRTQGKDLASEA